ncbi:ABC transporter permease [Bacillus amyloliquefaciens]|uniref:ABC transporter permease n=1 Tax=Bacillus amyloliquefaciens TaxID=1390 RepID=UPI003C76C884
MSLLVRNEFMKLKRLKSIYVIFFLSFLPFLINGIGLLTMNENTDWNKFYMFVFNQYSILFPTVIFIFSGFYFYLEFKNRTMLNWMSYPYHKFKLILSKLAAAFLFLFLISAVNHIIHLSTLFFFFREDVSASDLLRLIATSFTSTTLSLLTIPIAALIAFLSKNIVVVMITGVASFLIMTILLASDVSIVFPFSFIYRFSIQIFENDMGYSNSILLVWGLLIMGLYVLLSLSGLYVYSKKNRM